MKGLWTSQQAPRGARAASWWAAAALALGGLQGCETTNPMHSYYYGDRAGGISRSNLIELNERATDALLQTAPLDANQPVLVATLVNVDRLTESSRLGRIFSEQIAGRMVHRGLKVTEVKLRENLLLQRDQGELLAERAGRGGGHVCGFHVGGVHQPQAGEPGRQHRGGGAQLCRANG
jgi:hypothetical protein